MILKGYGLGNQAGRTLYPYTELDGKFVEIGIQCFDGNGDPMDVGSIMVTAEAAIEMGKLLIQVGQVARLATMLDKTA